MIFWTTQPDALESVSVKLRMQLKDFIASLAETTKTEKHLEQRLKEAKGLQLGLTQPETTKKEQPIQDRAALPYDVSKLKWLPRANAKGDFEVCEDFENPELPKLRGFLDMAGGGVMSEGFWYWLYRDNIRVGRKDKRKKKEPA